MVASKKYNLCATFVKPLGMPKRPLGMPKGLYQKILLKPLGMPKGPLGMPKGSGHNGQK